MSTEPRPLTILFADIGGSAALYKREGDARAHRLVAESLACMRKAVSENQGTVLRTVGDSVLASFETPDQAFLGARDIQRVHRDMPVSVRIGFHSGLVIPDDGDVYGHAVNIAARVAEFSRVDEIMATADAVEQLSDCYQPFLSGADSIEVKGVAELLTVHRLHWQDQPVAVTRLASRQEFEKSTSPEQRLQIRHGNRIIYAGAEQVEISLGRASDNDIAVSNDEASRHHARIRFRNGQFLMQDESTNGTFVRKDSLLPFLVRRDSIVLDGRGVLCLGVSPEQTDAEMIEFELLQA
ncbi:adenylate/guanylate cyclase domain-containing protein [Granulosicoccus sp. 3-233]|uniref:adenylate/guanylate cyclase domain-containing protein n=1 Tax=Granulosicoccus sp. 3-233 TaxID=3417969 RepID=UPI003D32FF31